MKELAAVIFENRLFDDTADICKQHMRMLPIDTKLYLFTSDECIEEYTHQFKKINQPVTIKSFDQAKPLPTSLKYNNIIQQVQQDKHLNALLNYCLNITDAAFWKQFLNYNRVLIFQRDTMLLKRGIEKFYEYDYVGAPCYNFVKDQTIQNGGLSLRNPQIMEYICRMYSWTTDLQDMMVVGQYSSASFFAEDIFFCLRMIKYNIGQLAPFDIAKKFSCEVKFELGTLGYHAIEKYFTEEEVKSIQKQYTK